MDRNTESLIGAVFLAGLIAAGLVSGSSTVVAFGLLAAAFGYLAQVSALLIGDFSYIPLGLWAASIVCAVLGLGFWMIVVLI